MCGVQLKDSRNTWVWEVLVLWKTDMYDPNVNAMPYSMHK